MRNSRLEALLTRILKNQVLHLQTLEKENSEAAKARAASDDLISQLKETMRAPR